MRMEMDNTGNFPDGTRFHVPNGVRSNLCAWNESLCLDEAHEDSIDGFCAGHQLRDWLSVGRALTQREIEEVRFWMIEAGDEFGLGDDAA